MKVVAPITMTDAVLDASNVAETDYAEWDISTTYAASAYVIVLSTHKVYQSVQASNLGNDPTTDDGTWWTEVGATNRWKAFDGRISDVVSNSASITYDFTPATTVTGIVFLGLNAGTVTVTVEDSSVTQRNLFDGTEAFENASFWSPLNLASITNNALANPVTGAATADKLIEDTATGAHRVQQNVALTSGNVYVFSVYVKADERTQVGLQMNASAFAATIAATFDLTIGAGLAEDVWFTEADTAAILGESAGFEGAGIMNLGDGWFRIFIYGTATATASNGCLLMLASGDSRSYTGDGTSGAYFYAAQIEAVASSVIEPTDYQFVTTAGVWDIQTFSEERDLTSSSSVPDWFAYFFDTITYDTEAIFEGIPGYATTTTISVDIDAGAGTAEVGQIVLGKVEPLGETLEGTRLGIRDFSFKDFDDFGRAQIVERRFARNVDFSFAMAATDARRVDRLLASLRATPAVYYADADVPEYGAIAFGFFRDFDIPLQHQGKAFVTLEIEGLT